MIFGDERQPGEPALGGEEENQFRPTRLPEHFNAGSVPVLYVPRDEMIVVQDL